MAITEPESKRSGDTRERILREAEKLYHSGGYQKISLEEVAKALGIKKPALFYHYKNKQELFHAMLKAMLSRMNQIVTLAISQGGPTTRGRLLAILHRMTLEPGFDVEHFLREDYEILSEQQRDEISQVWYKDIYFPIRRVFEEGTEQGELKRHNLNTSTYMYLNLWMLLPRVDSPITRYNWNQISSAEYIEEMLDLFLGGLRH